MGAWPVRRDDPSSLAAACLFDLRASDQRRKSTDQNIADEEKSVTRQVERARAYAARKGWTVAEEHVYTDDGISGAEFRSARDSSG